MNIFNLLGGDIKLTLENEYETIEIQAKDIDPIQINYISFGSSDNSLGSPQVEFFYNCHGIQQPLKSFESTELLNKCKRKDVTGSQDEYNDMIQNVTEVDGIVRIPLMMKAEKDLVVILHSMNNRQDPNHKSYSVGK